MAISLVALAIIGLLVLIVLAAAVGAVVIAMGRKRDE